MKAASSYCLCLKYSHTSCLFNKTDPYIACLTDVLRWLLYAGNKHWAAGTSIHTTMTGQFVHGNIESRNMALHFHNVPRVDTIRYAMRANAELYKRTDMLYLMLSTWDCTQNGKISALCSRCLRFKLLGGEKIKLNFLMCFFFSFTLLF